MSCRAVILPLVSALAVAQSPVKLSEVLSNHQFAFDSARQRIVVPLTSEVWEHDGAGWALMGATVPGFGRIVADDVQGRLFHVGNVVYEYDGHTFVPRPGLRSGVPTKVVADTARSVLVGLGGANGAAVDEWDGTQWSTVATLPPATVRALQSAAYDPLRGVTVFSGIVVGGVPSVQTETWEWDGAVLSGPFLLPSSVLNTLMAFDPGLGQVVAFRPTGVFAWSNGAWTQVSAAVIPSSIAAVVTDRGNQRVLGMSTVSGRRDGVWQWQGGAWSPLHAAPQPDMVNALICRDEGRDRLFAFGMTHGVVPVAAVVAEWDGSSWSAVPVPGAPTRSAPEIPVSDAARGEIVVFGGRDSITGMLGDTWAWNGTIWRLAATTGPSPRMGAAIAYDSLRGRVVLVGGNGGPAQTSDHWEWDGVAWTQVFAATPMGGIGGVLGFDPVRNRMLYADMLGGAYEYDGVSWTFLGNTGGEPRSIPVFDPSRQRLVCNLNLNGVYGRFEWTGSAWLPIAGANGHLAYDAVAGRMLVMDDVSLRVETPTAAASVDVGTGCSNSSLATTLTAFGAPRPGNAGFHLDVRADAAIRPLALVYGFGTMSQPLGSGCSLHVLSPFASIFWFTDASGFAQIPTAIPDVAALRGVALATQAGVLDPLAPLGAVLTQGLVLTLGD